MKYTIAAAIVVILGGMAYNGYLNEPTEAENVKVEKETVEQIEETVEVDMIEAAKVELERINAELDAEETRLLEDKAAVEAKAAAEVLEIESKLEQIRETRTSFQ